MEIFVGTCECEIANNTKFRQFYNASNTNYQLRQTDFIVFFFPIISLRLLVVVK